MNSKFKIQNSNLDMLVAELLNAPKYAQIEPELIRQVGAQVLRSTPQHKAAVKETKSRLHQSAAAYVRTPPRYETWLAQLAEALGEAQGSGIGDHEKLKQLCLQIMAQHASTYERAPHLEAFYTAIFAKLGPVTHILDLGCGLNPLALPWMPVAANIRYDACDIFADMVAFVQAFLALIGNPGNGFVCNLTQHVPQDQVDCVLALKLLPVLEQLQRGSAIQLLERLNAPQIIVSYPTQSLGGRKKGMAANYERQLYSMLEGKTWDVEPVEAPGELVFLIRKS